MTFDSVAGVTDTQPTEIFLPKARFFPNDYVLLIGDPNPLAVSSSFDSVNNILSVRVDPNVTRHVITVTPRDYIGP